MASYRIYLFGEGAICGRHDFAAPSDQNAIEVALVLFDACADDCQSFDLWRGTKRIAIPRLVAPRSFDELSAANQELVVETEEGIVQSEWNVAKSRRLLETLERKSSLYKRASVNDRSSSPT